MSKAHLQTVTNAHEQERAQKKIFDAQKRDEWNQHPARIAVARAVEAALEAGEKKSAINRAMNSTNFTTFQMYLDLLKSKEVTDAYGEGDLSVLVISDTERIVSLHNYFINGELHNGDATFKLVDGDWLNQTETPMGVAVEQEIFFSTEPNPIQEAFHNV